MCLLTNERYKTYQTGFSFCRLGHVPVVGLRGTVGIGGVKTFFSKIQPDLACELLTEWHMQPHNVRLIPAPWGLGEGPKGQISLNPNYKVNFKDFKPNCVCLLTNERYEIYQMGFSCGPQGHVPGEGLGGTLGSWGSKNILKFNQISCVRYSHEWHMQRHIFFCPCPLGPLAGTKRSNIIKFQLQSQFQRF